MTKQDRQKLNIFIILLVILGLTVVLGWRMSSPPTVFTVQPAEPKPVANVPGNSEAKIRLDWVEQSEEAEAGRTNVFQYRLGRPAPAPSKPAAPLTATQPVLPPPAPVVPPAPPSPPPPPPPPPIPLKYQGFAVMNSGNTDQPALMAFLTDESSHHYNVSVGEVLVGRYRIVDITDKNVEVEDLQNKRRLVFPLVK
jgi:hypothetical protein